MARIGSRAPPFVLGHWPSSNEARSPDWLLAGRRHRRIGGVVSRLRSWRGQRVVGVLPRPDWVAIQAVELSTPSLGGKRSFGGSSSYAYSNAHIARDGERAPVVAWVFNQELAVRKTSFGRR